MTTRKKTRQILFAIDFVAGMCMIAMESQYDTRKIAPYPPVHGDNFPVYHSFGLFQVRQLIYRKKNLISLSKHCNVKIYFLLYIFIS